MPRELRALVERGSTSFEERGASDAGELLPRDVDRVVFWSARPDGRVTALAEAYAAVEAAERREAIVFVTGEEAAAPSIARLSPNEWYVWPRDEDRLKMAFLTGA